MERRPADCRRHMPTEKSFSVLVNFKMYAGYILGCILATFFFKEFTLDEFVDILLTKSCGRRCFEVEGKK